MDLERMDEKLSAPALRALSGNGIRNLEDLAGFTRNEIEELHGIGGNALRVLDGALAKAGLAYRDEDENEAVTAYVNGFEGEIRERLTKIRTVIRETIPKAKEKMAYGMPTYYYGENIIHFAGFKNHVGLFPTPEGIESFREKLKGFETSKGTIQFGNDAEIPYDLIKEIARHRMDEAMRAK